jgi:hypothetical protein
MPEHIAEMQEDLILETNKNQSNIGSTNENIHLLFFSERFSRIRSLVSISVLCSIVLLGRFGGLFSCLLTNFQIAGVPLLGTLMYLRRVRFITFSQRLKEAVLVGGMIGFVSASSNVLITMVLFYVFKSRQNFYPLFGYTAPPLKLDVILVEIQIWLVTVVFMTSASSVVGLFASLLPMRNWREANADE